MPKFDGKPCRFLGQFFLGDSWDILPQKLDRQKDLILIFDTGFDTLSCEWHSKEQGAVVECDPSLISLNEYYGVRCRTKDVAWNGERPIPCIAPGFKIGGICPSFDNYWWEGDQVFCGYSPFYPEPGVPWPFSNIEDPWDGLENRQDFDESDWLAAIAFPETNEDSCLKSLKSKAYYSERWSSRPG